jgi:hypothetical protein
MRRVAARLHAPAKPADLATSPIQRLRVEKPERDRSSVS